MSKLSEGELSSHPDHVMEGIHIDLESLVPDEEPAFDKKIIEEVEATETPPEFNSEEWHEYIVRQFMEEEMDNGKPVRDGLVRVVEKFVGPIYRREIVSYVPADSNNKGTATVHIRLHLNVKNENHPLSGFDIIEDGIAEVNRRNTPSPFDMHASATASSKAEAQALRKILRLRKMVSADEVTPESMVDTDIDVFVPDEPVSNEQITVLDLICKRADISVLDFVSSGEIKYVFIEQVPSSKASKMIKFLNEIQSGKQKNPVTKKYDPAWREKNQKRATNESEN